MRTRPVVEAPKAKLSSLLILVFSLLLPLIISVPFVSAQPQPVTVSPGYINLGMTPTITVTAPAAGTYVVVVKAPSGSEAQQSVVFTAAGQTQNETYGNSTAGFNTTVSQVGTYDVFLESAGQVVGSTSFYATNKLVITMDMVTGGTCTFVSDITRGEKFIPRFYLHYASNGASLTNNTKGVQITFTLPNGAIASASWDSFSGLFDTAVLPNWNYTSVGTWNPTVNASDAAGNTGTFKYSGIPFAIAPAELSTTISVLNAATGKVAAGLYNGEGVTIQATVTYPTNAEPVKGFVGPLDPTRGGSATAEIGWGYYNATTNAFGGPSPGGLIATVPLTYSGSNGVWTANFTASSLPAENSYLLIVNSHDSASPANTGSATMILGAATPTTTSSVPLWLIALVFLALAFGTYLGVAISVPRQSKKVTSGT